MKHFILGLLLICLLYPCAYGDDSVNVPLFDDIQSEFETVRKDLLAQYPELGASLDGKSEIEQIGIMRSFLARRMFDHYKQKYMSELYAMADETGRAVKTSVREFTNAGGWKRIEYWLDRGELDEPRCDFDFEARTACDIPDGFVEYSITYETNTKNSDSLQIIKDDRANNRHDDILISLDYIFEDKIHADSIGAESENCNFDITTHSVAYDKQYEYMRALVEDIRGGIAHRVPNPENPSLSRWEFDPDPKWKSNQFPIGSVSNYSSTFYRDKR